MTEPADVRRERGARAEALAADYLTERGYRIVTRNYRCRGGEIDIVAWDEEVLCFVEVRARSTDAFGDPLETIGRDKVRRLGVAARCYLAESRVHPEETRFDAVGVLLRDPPQLRLIKAAFEL